MRLADWDPSPWYDSPKEARRADRVEQFAIAAAAEAMAAAGEIGVDPARFGTIFATGIGGLETLEEQVVVRIEKGERRVSPFLVPMLMANASGAAISMRYGLQGPNETICTACAAGTPCDRQRRQVDRLGSLRRGRHRGHRGGRDDDVAGRVRKHDGVVDVGRSPARSTSSATGS